MRSAFRYGFTLIELLTVIAIIAVLSAILLPVFSRVKEGVRQTTCLSNMQDIGRALGMYKADHGEYPAFLLGYAEDSSGAPATGPTAVLASQIKQRYLFPLYVKSIDTFHCPDNPVNNPATVAGGQIVQVPGVAGAGPANFGQNGFAIRDPNGTPLTGQIPFYAYDSYDVTSALDPSGNPIANQLEVVYARSWTNNPGKGDAPNQLIYRTPPGDKTIVAWCNYHVTTAKGNRCPVLFASGSAKTFDYAQVAAKGWQFGNQ